MSPCSWPAGYSSAVRLIPLAFDSCFVFADGGGVTLAQPCHRTAGGPEPEIEREKRKREEGGWLGGGVSLYGGVEEDNNIVNQMWLRLLLHSKPWHLPSLVYAEGGFLKTCCHERTYKRESGYDSVCTECAHTEIHLFKWILQQTCCGRGWFECSCGRRSRYLPVLWMILSCCRALTDYTLSPIITVLCLINLILQFSSEVLFFFIPSDQYPVFVLHVLITDPQQITLDRWRWSFHRYIISPLFLTSAAVDHESEWVQALV